MRVLSLAGFKDRYHRAGFRGVIGCLCAGVLMSVIAVYSGDSSNTVWLVVGFFGVIVGAGVLSLSRLYSVRCPMCTNKLSVRKRRKELPDTYSGFCRQCDTLWDLDIENRPTL
jgi:hypothetical protein